MKLIIVEDEVIARQRLIGFLNDLIPNIEILGEFEGVVDTVNWLKHNDTPDIAFFDVQLSDATCFEIFEQVNVPFPVIFLTAYDNYVMESFEYNAIHYLLKPATKDKVKEALAKVQRFKSHFVHQGIQNLIENQMSRKEFSTRLIVRKGLDTVPIEVSQIAYFFSEHKITFAKTVDDQTYMIDETLADLENRLDPSLFFRANRQYLIQIKALRNFRSTNSSKIQLELKPSSKSEVVVSKESAPRFRKWVKG